MEHIVISPAGAPLDASQAFLVPDTRAAIELAVESFLARLDEQDAAIEGQSIGAAAQCRD